MKLRFSLSRRIFALAFLNVTLLLILLLTFAHFQFHLEIESFRLAPVRDRLEAVASQVALDLEQTPVNMRTGLLNRYAASYGVDFFLFENNGVQLGGRPVQLPTDVESELQGERARGQPRPPPPPPPRGRGPGSPGVRQAFQLSAEDLYWVGMRIPIAAPGGGPPVRGTMILAAKSFYGTPLFFDFKPWLEVLAALIAVFLICWLPFIHGLTKTISSITRAAGQMEQGNFDHQLPEGRGDELGALSVAINRMAARLSGFAGGQKRFLGDIAHELCAPVARMQFALGILEQRAEARERPALEDVQEEMRQMSDLVSELLSFSRTGMEPKDRVLNPVDVAEVARQAVAREGGGIDCIHVEIAEPLLALADREYLLRSLCNLIRNSVRYAGDAGTITISAQPERKEVVICVSDCGPGLAPEELDRVFTPFYRLETSRNRQHGGAGLGLAIVKSCIEGCRGKVRCRNRQPTGLEVEIRLTAP